MEKENKMFFRVMAPKPDAITNQSNNAESYDIFYTTENGLIYFPAIMNIKVLELERDFSFVLWLETNKEEYSAKTRAMDSITSLELSCTIAGIIPFYKLDETVEVVVRFELNDIGEYPTVIDLKSESDLEYDFYNGISKAKYLEWMECLHSDKLSPSS